MPSSFLMPAEEWQFMQTCRRPGQALMILRPHEHHHILMDYIDTSKNKVQLMVGEHCIASGNSTPVKILPAARLGARCDLASRRH
jgi:hypothetical protein